MMIKKNQKQKKSILKESNEGKILDSFQGGKEIKESEQEDDENIEKLKHIEQENRKLTIKNRELKIELSNCEEENHEL